MNEEGRGPVAEPCGTYAEAMGRVYSLYAPVWQETHPGRRFRAEAEGFEDRTHYLVPVGDRDLMARGVLVLDDAPAVLVSKATGEVSTAEVLANLERLDAMTPVRAECEEPGCLAPAVDYQAGGYWCADHGEPGPCMGPPRVPLYGPMPLAWDDPRRRELA